MAVLGNVTITTGAVKNGTQEFASYAAAVGAAAMEAAGLPTARSDNDFLFNIHWFNKFATQTIGAFDTSATANPDVSTTSVSGFGTAVADWWRTSA